MTMTTQEFVNNVFRKQNLHQTEEFFKEYLNNFMDNHPAISQKIAELEKYRNIQNLANGITDLTSQPEE